MDPKDEDLNAIVGACVAHSTGRAGWSPPLSLALLAR